MPDVLVNIGDGRLLALTVKCVAAVLDKAEDVITIKQLDNLGTGKTLRRPVDLQAEDLELNAIIRKDFRHQTQQLMLSDPVSRSSR